MIGAQYMLTGKILEVGSKKKTFSGYNVNISTTMVQLVASAEIIETATSRKVFSKKVSSERKLRGGGNLSIDDGLLVTEMADEVAKRLVGAIMHSERLKQIAKAAMPSEEATITIISSPENADVEIDGVYRGNAGNPLDVTAGLLEIKVTLPGYELWEKKVMVKDGMTFHVRLMEKVDKKLKIDIKEEIKTK
jgi:hypothetical protein